MKLELTGVARPLKRLAKLWGVSLEEAAARAIVRVADMAPEGPLVLEEDGSARWAGEPFA